jgi:hypothetical protein
LQEVRAGERIAKECHVSPRQRLYALGVLWDETMLRRDSERAEFVGLMPSTEIVNDKMRTVKADAARAAH